MTALLDAALGYAARGWPVFPCQPGAKAPAGQLVPHGVLDASTDQATIRTWWQQLPDANVGIATGGGGPDVLDVDVKNGDGYPAFTELTTAGLAAGAYAYVITPSGGLHAYYAGTGQRNGSLRKHHIDFRSAGGYVLAPPSAVGGKPYRVSGAFGDPGAVVDWAAIRVHLDPPPDPVPFTQPGRDATPDGELRPGDHWALTTSWPQILVPRGWRRVRDFSGGRAGWCRPGKHGSFISATTRDDGGLYVFSTSTEFETEVPYTKFGALSLLEHGGDHAAAARALRAAGYGTPLPAPAPLPAAAFRQPAGSQDSDGQPPHSSWHPRDLTAILNGDASGDPEPAFLARDDGKMLLYAGKVNALIGESESGKTWIALAAVAQALAAGQHVVYLDFEDAPAGIVGRLISLGATRGQLAKQFRYISPDEPLTMLAAADLAAVLAGPVPDLVVVDGVNAAMTMMGLNLKDNKDATEFSQRILRPLKRTGAAVLTVDHVTKNADGRGSYAIGAQAKRADIDGAAYLVEPLRKFGRGQQGKLRLTVSKDRPGHVRAISSGATYAGMAILTPHDDGTITVEISAPDMRPASEKPAFRPTKLMERVSQFLETHPDGATTNTVETAVRGKARYVADALAELVVEGYASRQAGPRNSHVHRSVKPYREASEPQTRPVPDRFPTGSPIPGNRSSDEPDDRFPPVPHPPAVGGDGTGNRSASRDAQEPLPEPPPVPALICTSCGERGHTRSDCPAIPAATP